jgi:hypothetical protein
MKKLLNYKTIAGVSVGACLGFAYWYFVGCSSGSCPITSVWYHSTLYGAMVGFFATGLGEKGK